MINGGGLSVELQQKKLRVSAYVILRIVIPFFLCPSTAFEYNLNSLGDSAHPPLIPLIKDIFLTSC